jgi:hypothetical protein
MSIKFKVFVLSLAVLLLAGQGAFVSAQEEGPPNRLTPEQPEIWEKITPDRLTPEQMQHAIVVRDGQYISRPVSRGVVFRLATCNATANPESPCYFVIGGSGGLEAKVSGAMNPTSWNATITCGVRIYDSFGFEGAKLQQNINVTFWGSGASTPVTMNWGDLRGTQTYHIWWYWTELSGPNPNPGWGIYVPSTGTAYSIAGGLLVYDPPDPLSGWTTYVSSRLTINSSGWYCS